MPSIPETHRYLLDAPVGSLATIDDNGRPQVSAIWFLAEGDTVSLSLNTARHKTKNLMARPGICFYILDVENTARYLELRGDAVVEPDDDYEFATKLATKYGGIDIKNIIDKPGDTRVKVTIDPARIHAIDMAAG